eukprot:364427_1
MNIHNFTSYRMYIYYDARSDNTHVLHFSYYPLVIVAAMMTTAFFSYCYAYFRKDFNDRIMSPQFLWLLVFCIMRAFDATEPSSFNMLPNEIQRLIYSHFSAKQHASFRMLSRKSNDLFHSLHATESKEVQQWIKLKTFLSNLQMDETNITHTLFTTLLPYCEFLKLMQWTDEDIIKIEKLFVVLLNNHKLQRHVSKAAVASYFYSILCSPAVNMPSSEGLNALLDALFNPVELRSLEPNVRYLWKLAAAEMNLTHNVQNRFTLAALGVIRVIIDTNFGTTKHQQITQETANSLWSVVPPDLVFLRLYLAFDELLIHPIKNKEIMIRRIVSSVFKDDVAHIFDWKDLDIFCIAEGILWDLKCVLESVAMLRDCMGSEQTTNKFMDWIFEYKLSTNEYNISYVTKLLVDNRFLSKPLMDIIIKEPSITWKRVRYLSFMVDEPSDMRYDSDSSRYLTHALNNESVSILPAATVMFKTDRKKNKITPRITCCGCITM